MPGLDLLNTREMTLALPGGGTLHGCTLKSLRDAQKGNAAITDALILTACRGVLADEIDADAERRRLAVITPGTGKAMEYQETARQADALSAWAEANAGKAPDPADYPMLAATVGVDIDPGTGKPATDVLGVMRAVLKIRAAWGLYAAALKGACAKGREAVATAGTPEAAAEAFDAVAWPAAA